MLKEIIMKILSIIIHGGTQRLRGNNKLKHCLFFLILTCFFYSCDIWHMQAFEGYNKRIVELQNETSTIQVSCSYFHGCYYLHYSLKGDCTVNYDSLKLCTNDDNLIILSYLPCKGVHEYKQRKEESFSIRLGFNRKETSISEVEPLVLSILPSNFIMYNGQRIINDTLRVELKSGLKVCR